MLLIKEIEIAYFRSIYKFSVTGCQDLNIIFGRNDAGKSNVLRALNLFFSGETNLGQQFNFPRDFCHARLAESQAATDIRKFVYVKIWFNTPNNWRASLGKFFWVKKQWNITTDNTPQTTSSIHDPSRQQYLTRFLNKIKLHYVPAIKDRKIFENLQAEIYRTISSHSEFTESLRGFAKTLSDRTTDLSAEILRNLNINSVVSTPADLTDLFRSLDFETTAEAGDSCSLTLQRGDGIQVRHIPEILSFLSNNDDHDFHIWGFEEPENSLELANAILEADAFRQFSRSRNKQIFVTSHSPAFFSLEEENVRRYFISRNEHRQSRPISTISVVESSSAPPSDLMGETPHLPVISYYLREANAKIIQSQATATALAAKISESNLPVVFVEGESDKIIFEKAWEIFCGSPQMVRFESAGGTTKMGSLGGDGPVFAKLAPERKVFAIIDNDKEGRSLFTNRRLVPGGKWIQHNSNKVYWCRLPFIQEFSHLMGGMRIDNNDWPGCLENIFSAEIRRQATESNSYQLAETPHAELVAPKYIAEVSKYLTSRPDGSEYFVLGCDEDFKIPFAHWVIQKSASEPAIFAPLRPVIEGLRERLS